ncbi:DUF4235 domain-containing protein [Nocardioides sp. Root151]|uniref:DUF4235 domain-containing protein n=1 Tax=Nocardioides sp. Root151 TaxID=1736475 RepID=UPI000702E52D|nr:DUF4235 domain-containing protein [Nocardioides sp. Root151]KQZ70689.1 hypothetical protein ASD66_14015 [Nocardioides sp. Root151]
MANERSGSTSAKVLYRPVGLVTSVVAGLLASSVFRWVWKRAAHGDRADPPKPLESEYALKEILAAAVVQGAIYAVVRALTERGGARAFERVTGDWPGS